MTTTYDFLIVGAGIVGAALAAEISRRKPGSRILVTEKEAQPAFHQTGRNSGVVHSGVYYTPGSLKARLCREGAELTKAFCAARGIAYEERGKLIVATEEEELPHLDALVRRAADNGVVAHEVDRAGLSRLEPAVAGRAGLRIPSTAIVDYVGVTRALLADLENAGGTVLFNSELRSLDKRSGIYEVDLSGTKVEAARIISCSGLTSDRVARLLGIDPGVKILPFRGEYFVLPSRLNTVVSHMIYPVPDPTLPFLGVHLTPMIDGTITVGPNAVLALAREKYNHFSVDLGDAVETLTYPGLWRMLARHKMATWQELKGSLFKSVYLRNVRRYCPQIEMSDLAVYRSANRAQALNADGTLVDDFLIKTSDGVTAVLNAPSPAATSAMPIASRIASEIL